MRQWPPVNTWWWHEGGTPAYTLHLSVDCRKDDEQLQVGGSLSRIVVPHPVMQEPRGVQLLYTAYSGWISSGLARWSVDKVTLSDSFGKRYLVLLMRQALFSRVCRDLAEPC